MPVPRITPYTLESDDFDAVKRFYGDVVGLDVGMEYDSFLGFNSPDNQSAQIVTTRPGIDAPLPRFGIDVGSPEAVDAIHATAVARGAVVRYGPTTEPWGIRRCFLEDPTGAVVSILAHADVGESA